MRSIVQHARCLQPVASLVSGCCTSIDAAAVAGLRSRRSSSGGGGGGGSSGDVVAAAAAAAPAAHDGAWRPWPSQLLQHLGGGPGQCQLQLAAAQHQQRRWTTTSSSPSSTRKRAQPLGSSPQTPRSRGQQQLEEQQQQQQVPPLLRRPAPPPLAAAAGAQQQQQSWWRRRTSYRALQPQQWAAAAPAVPATTLLPHGGSSSSGSSSRGSSSSSMASSRVAAAAAAYYHAQPAAHHLHHHEYKMESLLIFESCWRRFEERYGMDFRVPREIVWLNGAPGSGKGVNTQHILKTRGLSKHFTISGLLESCPETRRLIDQGDMIPDALVGDLMLEALLLDEPGLQDDLGFVVDGFPRTACQVDFLKLLYDKMVALHRDNADSPRAMAFPRPSFKLVVLYVDEETSIKRQLQRARIASMHNRRVLDAGAGQFFAERSTDTDVDKCRKRYAVFRTHYAATLRLKQYFPFTLIDAMGSLEETRAQITKELRYQSSLDLGAVTYEMIRHLPLAKDVVQTARQELVMRLDGYCETSRELFTQVIDRILNDVMPVVRQSGLAGHAEYVTRSPFFTEHPAAVDMLVDVLTDRGFHVCYIREDLPVPERVDPTDGTVSVTLRPLHKFRIAFDARGPRDEIKALEIAARIAESQTASLQRDVRISHSVIPSAAPGGGSFAGGRDPYVDDDGGGGGGGDGGDGDGAEGGGGAGGGGAAGDDTNYDRLRHIGFMGS